MRPRLQPLDWVRYVCELENKDMGSLRVGEVLVVTGINRIWGYLIEKLGLKCSVNWLYDCKSRCGIHEGVVSERRLSLMRIGVGLGSWSNRRGSCSRRDKACVLYRLLWRSM